MKTGMQQQRASQWTFTAHNFEEESRALARMREQAAPHFTPPLLLADDNRLYTSTVYEDTTTTVANAKEAKQVRAMRRTQALRSSRCELMRYTTQCGRQTFFGAGSTVHWLTMGMEEAYEWRRSAKTMLFAQGRPLAKSTVRADDLVAFYFETHCALQPLLDITKRANLTLDDLVVATLFLKRARGSGDDAVRTCSIYAPLLIVSGRYYHSNPCRVSSEMHGMKIADCASLLLCETNSANTAVNGHIRKVASAHELTASHSGSHYGSEQWETWLLPALVPAANEYVLDLVTVPEEAHADAQLSHSEAAALRMKRLSMLERTHDAEVPVVRKKVDVAQLDEDAEDAEVGTSKMKLDEDLTDADAEKREIYNTVRRIFPAAASTSAVPARDDARDALLQRLRCGFGDGAPLAENAAALHILLSAMQRFHCERTVAHARILQTRRKTNGRAANSVAGLCDEARQMMRDAVYNATDAYRNCSLRTLMQQRGFALLARNVLQTLLQWASASAAASRMGGMRHKFHAEWFETTLCQIYTFVMQEEQTSRSESTTRALVEQSPALNRLVRVFREPSDAKDDYDGLYDRIENFLINMNDHYKDEENISKKRKSALVFEIPFDAFAWGDERAFAEMQRGQVRLMEGKVYCVYQTLSCVMHERTLGSRRVYDCVDELFVRSTRWPWLVHFLRTLLRRPSSVHKQSADALARLAYALHSVRDDLPHSNYTYDHESVRPHLLDSWPRRGARSASTQKAEMSFVRFLGMDAGNTRHAANHTSLDQLWDVRANRSVVLTPLLVSATPRALPESGARDDQLCEKLDLRPADDKVDALLERRALPPCVVAMEMRARDVRFIDTHVGYKHFDRIDHGSQLLSLVPEVLHHDDEMVAHIERTVRTKNASTGVLDAKMHGVMQDVRTVRQFYDKRQRENFEYLATNTKMGEEEAKQRAVGCLSCSQLARAQVQRTNAAHMRCPFADRITQRSTDATLKTYLMATAGTADIEDLANVMVDYCGKPTRNMELPSGEMAFSNSGRNAQRACAEFMLASRTYTVSKQKRQELCSLEFKHPRDYTRLALHLEHTETTLVDTGAAASGKRTFEEAFAEQPPLPPPPTQSSLEVHSTLHDAQN